MFRRTSTHYGQSPHPETPYQKAGQIWDDRIGSARVQARNWRLMALGLLVLLTASSAALVWRSLQSTVTPYVVEVDDTGSVKAVGPALANRPMRKSPITSPTSSPMSAVFPSIRSLSGRTGWRPMTM